MDVNGICFGYLRIYIILKLFAGMVTSATVLDIYEFTSFSNDVDVANLEAYSFGYL